MNGKLRVPPHDKALTRCPFQNQIRCVAGVLNQTAGNTIFPTVLILLESLRQIQWRQIQILRNGFQFEIGGCLNFAFCQPIQD